MAKNGNHLKRALVELDGDLLKEIEQVESAAANHSAITQFLGVRCASALNELYFERQIAKVRAEITKVLMGAFKSFGEGFNAPDRVLRIGEIEVAYVKATDIEKTLTEIETRHREHLADLAAGRKMPDRDWNEALAFDIETLWRALVPEEEKADDVTQVIAGGTPTEEPDAPPPAEPPAEAPVVEPEGEPSPEPPAESEPDSPPENVHHLRRDDPDWMRGLLQRAGEEHLEPTPAEQRLGTEVEQPRGKLARARA